MVEPCRNTALPGEARLKTGNPLRGYAGTPTRVLAGRSPMIWSGAWFFRRETGTSEKMHDTVEGRRCAQSRPGKPANGLANRQTCKDFSGFSG